MRRLSSFAEKQSRTKNKAGKPCLFAGKTNIFLTAKRPCLLYPMQIKFESKMGAPVPSESRLGRPLGRFLNFLLLGGPLLNIHGILSALPSFLQLCLGLALGGYLVKKLVTFHRWNDELQHVGKFVKSVIALLVVVIVENFCTWYDRYIDRGGEQR